MFGPYCEPLGGVVIPASSFIRLAGMLTIVQCRIGAPARRMSASCMMIAYDFVPAGPAVQARPGKTLPLYCVFSNGISAPDAKEGDVTVSFASPLAGRFTIASCD